MDSLIKTFEYNKIETLQKVFDENPSGQIAAVIMEPISTEEPKDGFLEKVRDLTHKYGALLIFDEVVTGFRLALGGAQEYYKVTPDLAAFGKAIANGMPLSVVAGKKEIMQQCEDVFFSLTNGGETLSLAAARATIKEIQENKVIEHIWKIGQKLKDGISISLKEHNLPIEIKGLPVHFVLVCKDCEGKENLELKSLLIQEMAKRGILMGGYFNICFAHTERDVEKTLKAINETFDIMKQAVSAGNIKQFLVGAPVQPVFRKV
jgi:glutamate-1-semialdehyde aminotransferase